MHVPSARLDVLWSQVGLTDLADRHLIPDLLSSVPEEGPREHHGIRITAKGVDDVTLCAVSAAGRGDGYLAGFGVVARGPGARPQGGGRRRAGDRETLAAIIFVLTSDCTWRQLPLVFGPCWQTVYRRFAQGSLDRVWARLHRVVLDELGARGELGWSRCAIDSVSVRAAKGRR
ncbi:transposase [Streptomyces echinatus]|uniref:transposase n=1 Tax=Streptomyces echinatus TaxID=67293 RepID=UPI0037BA77C2